jgi:hypothetical protein
MDLWMTTRPTTQSAWSPPVNLGPTINSPYDDAEPVISRRSVRCSGLKNDRDTVAGIYG